MYEEMEGSSVSFDVVVETFLEVDYIKKLMGLKEQFGGIMLTHEATHVVIFDGVYLGDLSKMITFSQKWGIEDAEFGNTILFNRLAREEFAAKMLQTGRPIVFMEFADGSLKKQETPPPEYGKIVIEL